MPEVLYQTRALLGTRTGLGKTLIVLLQVASAVLYE